MQGVSSGLIPGLGGLLILPIPLCAQMTVCADDSLAAGQDGWNIESKSTQVNPTQVREVMVHPVCPVCSHDICEKRFSRDAPLDKYQSLCYLHSKMATSGVLNF